MNPVSVERIVPCEFECGAVATSRVVFPDGAAYACEAHVQMLLLPAPVGLSQHKETVMNFGQAIEAMKAGQLVQRAGWNGKNMHIYLEDGYTHPIGDGVFKGQAREYEPVICMYTAQGKHQPGWLANQPDILAEDWQVVSGS